MITTIDTTKIKNLVILQGKIEILPDNVKTCGQRNEHFDFVIKYRYLEAQIICRDNVGRQVLDMGLKRGDTVSVIGYLEDDSDMIIVADSVEKI